MGHSCEFEWDRAMLHIRTDKLVLIIDIAQDLSTLGWILSQPMAFEVSRLLRTSKTSGLVMHVDSVKL